MLHITFSSDGNTDKQYHTAMSKYFDAVELFVILFVSKYFLNIFETNFTDQMMILLFLMLFSKTGQYL
jgi:hypothetical protein